MHYAYFFIFAITKKSFSLGFFDAFVVFPLAVSAIVDEDFLTRNVFDAVGKG